MTQSQRRVFLVVSLIGLAYFAAFFIPNSYGARSDKILLDASGDEYVTYPTLVRILTPGKTFNETRANIFLYEDYHYGYPFYAASALVLLPVRLIYGMDFTQHMQLNLLLLRQFISALPMILAALLLVWMQTRFLSMWRAVALFLFLLTIRGVVRNDMWWWHPDALAVLCVVLTLFFLDRDRLRLGRNFYLAAIACGMATSIKLLGAFFFLTIPLYLLAAVIKKTVTLPKSALAGGLFMLVMVGTLVATNPFLFSSQQRARMVMIQQQKQEELSKGYQHDDPIYYSKGPQWWASTLDKWYGSPLFLAFMAGSLVLGCWRGPRTFTNRLILTWVVPYSVYLLWFVAVKPDHYWLPVMLPLYSTALAGLDFFWAGAEVRSAPLFSRAFALQKLAAALIVLVLLGQFALNLGRGDSGNLPLYTRTIQQGKVQIATIK